MNLKQGRIGKQETASIALIACVACGIFSMNTTTVYASGNASYLSSAVAALLSLLLFYVIAEAMRRTRCKNLAQLYRFAFGRLLSIPIAFFTLVMLIYTAAMPLIRHLLIMNQYIYVLDEVHKVALYLVPCVLLLSWMGLEIIGRTAKLFAVLILLSFAVALIIAIPAYKSYRLYPLLGTGLKNTLLFSLTGVGRFFPPLLCLLVCGTGVHGVENAAVGAAAGALGGGLVTAIVQFLLGMTFPYYMLFDMPAPLYRLTMAVPSGSMFLRADKLLLFFWLLSGLITAGYFAYSAALLFTGTARMRDIRPASASVALVVCSVTLMGQLNLKPFLMVIQFLWDKAWLALLLPPMLAVFITLFKKEAAQ